jgi:hypothetical protein
LVTAAKRRIYRICQIVAFGAVFGSGTPEPLIFQGLATKGKYNSAVLTA